MSATERIVKDKKPVLFLGEGNFSFSTAIAARRGSWDEICATVNDQVPGNSAALNHKKLLAQINNVIKENLTPTKALDRIHAIASLKDGNPTRVGEIDATDLSGFFNPQATADERRRLRRNIYFQCPWTNPGSQTSFLNSIITSAANVQRPGNYLYFGLTKHTSYAPQYGLDDVIAHAEALGYERLEDDNSITTVAIAYGYHHHSDSLHDLHDLIRPHHYTLCLKKRDDDDTEDLPKFEELKV